MGAEYGPVHAAIKVGNVILEWDRTNLVVPHFESSVKDVVLQADMRRGSDVFKRAVELTKSLKSLSTQEEVKLLSQSNEKQQIQLKEMSTLIAKYNRCYYYNPVSRNCQNFVDGVLKVLNVSVPFDQLEVQLKKISQGTHKVPNSFKTHEDLDSYVTVVEDKGLLQTLTQGNIEILLQIYLQLHNQGTSTGACQHATCKMQDLQKIQKDKLENLEE